jgi:quercetin dioxygenase-like cupin family protein
MASPFIFLLGMMAMGMTGVLAGPSPREAEVYGAAGDGVQVETLARTTRSWDGATLPAYPRGQPLITVLRITVPPGVRLARHQHPVINAAVLLQGHLRVVAADGSFRDLRAGDSLIELVNTTHYGESLGPEPAVVLVVYAGEVGIPVTVEDKKD